MLHTIAGKILKSSYFWLPENPGCYTDAGPFKAWDPKYKE
jgi:hypothetical protein